MINQTPRDESEVVQHLTRRENQVLEMASRGLTNVEVGARLEISVHAVKFHLASIYRKLKVANRTEAAVIYTRQNGRPESTGGR
jgi:two-component system nitrate/nitrite response regulator NarL